MVPKPDVEWVKKALERLNIRVVNDRPGRRRKEEVQERLRRKITSNTSTTNIGHSLPSSLFQNTTSTPTVLGKRSPPPEYSNVISSESYPGHRLSESRTIGSYGMQGSTNSIPVLGSSGIAGMGNFDTTSFMKDEYNPIDIPNALPIRKSRFSDQDSNSYQAHSFDVATSFSGRSNPPGMDSAAESRRHYEILKEHHKNLLRELQQTTDMMQMYQNNYEQIEQESLDAMNNPVYSSATTSMMIHGAPQNSLSTSFRQTPSVSSNQQIYYSYDFPQGRSSLRAAQFPTPQRSNNFDRVGHVGLQTQDQNAKSRGISQYKAPTIPNNENTFAHNTMRYSRPNVETCDQYDRFRHGSFSEQGHHTDLNFDK